MNSLAILSLTVFAQGAALAQEQSANPAFEVASVKPIKEPVSANPAFYRTGLPPAITGDPHQIDFSAVTLMGVLSRAYDVRPNQIVGPDWLNSEWYNIRAKVPDDAPKGQVPRMLQNLLADRFRMRVHWETKEAQGYALVAGRNGPKLTKSASPDGDAPPKKSTSFLFSGRFTWKATTLDEFATSLTVMMGGPVVNMTGIEGLFDIQLDVAPDSLPGMPGMSTADSPYPTISVAIRNLGLSLEPQKEPLKQLIVDSAQKIPTAN
jgi:uncharacterized protein (TIGR03435 family)